MSYAISAANEEFWKAKIGLLPIFLHHNRKDGDKSFALLDGDVSNFCLDLNAEDGDQQNYRSIAWSANMQNYIKYDRKREEIRLFTLNNQESEDIPLNIVTDNIDKFYQYISKKSFEGDDIVKFIMRQFRIVRTQMREHNSAENSLKVFLYMLSKIDNCNAFNYWNLPKDIDESFNMLPKGKSFVEQLIPILQQGLIEFGFKPDISMIMRHASGKLFEEANFMATFNNQLNLFPTDELKYSFNPESIGAFYTPQFLARSLVEESLRFVDQKKGVINIFDPGCGPGQLLVETLRQLKNNGFQGKVIIEGWDKSPIAKIMADFQLEFEKTEWGNRLEYKIILRDSLTIEWPKDKDVIIMNPPYLSWTAMNGSIRSQIQTIIGGKYGKINLSEVFYYLGVQAVKKDGVIACVLPSNFLSAQTLTSLRNDLFDIVRPRLISKLGNSVFKSAFVDVCFIIASNNNNGRDDATEMLWTDNRDDVSSLALRALRVFNDPYGINIPQTNSYSIYYISKPELESDNIWSPIPSELKDFKMKCLQLVTGGRLKLVKDIFSVKSGTQTGKNEIFLISSEEYDSLSPNEKKYFRPVANSHSIYECQLHKLNYVFFPYPEEEYHLNDEEELRSKLPLYSKDFLFPNKELLSLRRGVVNHEINWWMLSWPRTWQFKREVRLVSAEFGHAGDFSIDENAEFVVERGCAWEFKDRSVDKENLYAYVAIFNSKVFDKLLKIYSKQLSGGDWYTIEKKYMDNIPIPYIIDHETYEDYDILNMIGHCMVKGVPYDKNLLNRIVEHLYV